MEKTAPTPPPAVVRGNVHFADEDAARFTRISLHLTALKGKCPAVTQIMRDALICYERELGL